MGAQTLQAESDSKFGYWQLRQCGQYKGAKRVSGRSVGGEGQSFVVAIHKMDGRVWVRGSKNSPWAQFW